MQLLHQIVTPFLEVEVLIRPTNKPPVAINAGTRVFFNSPDQLVSPNDIESAEERMQLQPPYSLLEPLPGHDPDGDRLRYRTALN